MEYRRTDSFKRDFNNNLNTLELKKIAKEKFKLFQEDNTSPILKVKKMRDYRDIWEGHITGKYVFTFHITIDKKGRKTYWFRRIGDHSIYDNP